MKQNIIEMLSQRHGGVEHVESNLRALMSRNPVEARLDLQVFLNSMGREEEAYQLSNELIELDPFNPRILFNRGWHLLKRGRLGEGLRHLEYGRHLHAYGDRPLGSRQPLWTSEHHRNARMILSLEGGLGDQIMQARFARNLVEDFGCHVTLACTPSLAPLLAQLKHVGAIVQREAAAGVFHHAWLPGMSAACSMGLEYSDVSGARYLTALPEYIEKWRTLTKTSRRLKIGLRWAGNPELEHQQLRRFEPDVLLDLAKFTDIQFFSFQRDDGVVRLPDEVRDLGPMLASWDDTAGAIENMDLMISSCTSVAHLAGALGKPTWTLVPALAYHLWAPNGDASPWYNSVRLMRQACYGDWSDVAQRVEDEVSRL